MNVLVISVCYGSMAIINILVLSLRESTSKFGPQLMQYIEVNITEISRDDILCQNQVYILGIQSIDLFLSELIGKAPTLLVAHFSGVSFSSIWDTKAEQNVRFGNEIQLIKVA